MLLLGSFTSALAMTDPWDCTEPADLAEMKAISLADPEEVWDRAWDEAYAWVDAACVSSWCGGDDYLTADSCLEASCVTTAGAEIEYHSDAYSWHTDGYPGYSTTKWLVVRLPAGAASWTELELRRYDVSDETSWNYRSERTWTASWVGILDAAWPADEAVSMTERGSSWAAGGSGTSSGVLEFAGTGCTWSVETTEGFGDECMPGWGDNEARTINAVSGSVTWEQCGTNCQYASYRGTWNGVDIGSYHPADWTPTGTTDADGDGFFAEDDDCDDTNAALTPCADEDMTNGVDDNCDGRTEVDWDLDGHHAIAWGGDDCDERNPLVYPGAAEIPCDGIDQDCDGADHCPPEDTGDTAAPDTAVSDTAPHDSGGGGSPRPRRHDRGGSRGCGGGAALGVFALLALRTRRAR